MVETLCFEKSLIFRFGLFLTDGANCERNDLNSQFKSNLKALATFTGGLRANFLDSWLLTKKYFYKNLWNQKMRGVRRSKPKRFRRVLKFARFVKFSNFFIELIFEPKSPIKFILFIVVFVCLSNLAPSSLLDKTDIVKLDFKNLNWEDVNRWT